MKIDHEFPVNLTKTQLHLCAFSALEVILAKRSLQQERGDAGCILPVADHWRVACSRNSVFLESLAQIHRAPSIQSLTGHDTAECMPASTASDTHTSICLAPRWR